MSTDALMAFVEKVAGDEALQGKVRAIAATESEQAERMADLGREHGFEFTPDEFLGAAKAAWELNQGELSEAALEAAAGGTGAGFGPTLNPQAFFFMTGLTVKNIQSP